MCEVADLLLTDDEQFGLLYCSFHKSTDFFCLDAPRSSFDILVIGLVVAPCDLGKDVYPLICLFMDHVTHVS